MSLSDLARSLDACPHFSIGHMDTPIDSLAPLEEAIRASGYECPELFMKRDDLTGLAFGGNKTRKLQWLVGDALEKDATILVTTGGVQSNHARQTAAAARAAGLSACLILFDTVPDRDAAYETSGNLLLDRWLGAEIHLLPGDQAGPVAIAGILEDLKARGEKPYFFPAGGSDAVGTRGYIAGYLELIGHCEEEGIEPTHIVHASSSGGTQAGLSLAAAFTPHGPRPIGINVYRQDSDAMRKDIAELANETAKALDLTPPKVRIDLRDGFLGKGYGLPTPETVDAVQTMALGQGILLDPVYSGKAFAGLLSMIREGEFKEDDCVVFLHTGGTPALFAYPEMVPTGTTD